MFTADDAVKKAAKGPVILVRAETTPDDIHGMEVAKGILTSRGGMTSHAAVVARGMGAPCVAGAGDINVDAKSGKMSVKGATSEGGRLDFDRRLHRRSFRRAGQTIDPDPTSGHFAKFMAWVDEFRTIGVRANAETPRDAKTARNFGAEGIGLCRTEHMFFEGERIQYMQAMILADNEKDRRAALKKLLPMQRKDFASICSR